MTPTIQSLDAVLPRVPAGIPALGGDLTDPEDRAVALRWLVELYREAECVPNSERMCIFCGEAISVEHQALSLDGGDEWQHTPRCPRMLEALETALFEPESDERGEGAQRYQGNHADETTGVSSKSNDWPPPAKGTHESDIEYVWPVPDWSTRDRAWLIPTDDPDPIYGRGGVSEAERAMAWSRTPSPPTPRITYHDAEEAR